MATESRGDELVREADKTLNKFTFFGSAGKKEDASELLTRAGNAYKVARNWDEAGKAFARAGGLQKELGNTHEATAAFTEAAKAFRKVAHEPAIEILREEVIPELTDAGRLPQAAKMVQEIAEMYEEDKNTAAALEAFSEAADLFTSADSAAAASRCFAKVAMMAAEEADYSRAIDTFMRMATDCAASALLKFNAKGHLMNAGLCMLACGDVVRIERALGGEFEAIDYSFPSTREFKLLQDITAAYNDADVDAFTDAVFNYDQITKLDPWKTSILLRVKTTLNNESKAAVDLT